jgi:hypothetical protein
VNADDLPRDPDLDDLPEELAEHPGWMYFGFIDPDTGAVYPLRRITREEVGTILADERRRREGGDDSEWTDYGPRTDG